MTPEQWARFQRIVDLTRDSGMVHSNSGPGFCLPDCGAPAERPAEADTASGVVEDRDEGPSAVDCQG